MLKLAVAVLTLALAGVASAAGWSSLRIDASSEAAFQQSLAVFQEKLSPARRQVFGTGAARHLASRQGRRRSQPARIHRQRLSAATPWLELRRGRDLHGPDRRYGEGATPGCRTRASRRPAGLVVAETHSTRVRRRARDARTEN